MKKILFVALLMMGALTINAQRTTIKVADLQKTIVDNVTRDYAGFTIKDATKIVANNVVSFEVVVVKANTHETLLYDKDGKFLKKMELRAGTVTNKPAAKHSAKPDVKPFVKK